MSALEISEKDFLTGARKGIQKSRLLSIARESGLTLKELCSFLRISTRSIQEKESSQLIAPGASERALYIARLFNSGINMLYTVYPWISKREWPDRFEKRSYTGKWFPLFKTIFFYLYTQTFKSFHNEKKQMYRAMQLQRRQEGIFKEIGHFYRGVSGREFPFRS